MRTTVTLDTDVEALVRKQMRERSISFKQALNEAVRAGLGRRGGRPPRRTPTFALGLKPGVDLDRALRLAGELEDEELGRRLAAGK